MGTLPAATGWQWLKQGFGLFRKQPGILTMLFFTNLMITLIISSIPYIGPLLAVILIPSVSIAVMQACFEIEQGQRVGPRVVLTGFQQAALRPLCKLGLVYLAASLLVTLLASVLIDAETLRQLSAQVAAPAPAQPTQADMAPQLKLLPIHLLGLVLFVALSFSAPLTFWQKMPLGKAVFYSVFAIIGAIKPMLVLLLSWVGIVIGIGMTMLAILGTAHAGRVIVVWFFMLSALLLQCAMYAAYRQIFGDPASIEKSA